MKFNKANLRRLSHIELEEDIAFPKEKMMANPTIIDIKNVHAVANISVFGELIKADVEIKGTFILECAYTLSPIKRSFRIQDTLQFSSEPQEEDDVLFAPDQDIDLDSYLFGLILTEAPLKAVKRGAKLPKNGKGFRVLTEEELANEKSEKGDPRFSDLDKFEE